MFQLLTAGTATIVKFKLQKIIAPIYPDFAAILPWHASPMPGAKRGCYNNRNEM